MEVMLTAVHQSQTGYNCTKGGRWNMPGPMKRPPPYFDEAKEYASPRSDDVTEGHASETQAADGSTPDTQPGTPKTAEPEANEVRASETQATEWTPPKDLPPCYEKLKEENGITEEKPPVQCPCFINEKDPTGQYRHLAALLPA